ncbi:unnamed protein product [Spirodela intermedia]|nr:unnamed protein product [Spirodela intermedia]CAA6669278.1 unnamed protein product [Spirodela intermedia]
MEMLRKMPVNQRGRILTMAFRSSTSCTVHSRHGFAREPSSLLSPLVTTAALFSHLS